jgi:beta-glucosidase
MRTTALFALGSVGLTLLLGGAASAPDQPTLGARSAPVITVGGLKFKDLNRNGKLDPYEDWRLSPQARARDLVARMTLDEKAGMMVHGTAPVGGDAIGQGRRYNQAVATTLIRKGVTSFITRLNGDVAGIATENNNLQAIAEDGRLGIPLTISTDPRNQFQATVGLSVAGGGFSLWPDPIGLAAVGDPAVTKRFGEVTREEYRAVGIQEGLSPQADLSTEPRWPRINGTFGEDANVARSMVQAYVQGLQGGDKGLEPGGVIAVVKHWVGYGAAKDGFDSHNAYGRFADLGGRSLDDAIVPFKGAFDAGVGGIMPTYSILRNGVLDGRPLEQVGSGFSKQLLTDLLRRKMGFTGVVLSDWSITNDCTAVCQGGWAAGRPPEIGMSWGVEALSRTDRFAKAINAGVDQLGGTEESELIVAAAKAGKIAPARINQAVTRILTQKFAIGLFENPYVDPAAVSKVFGRPAVLAEALAAQQRSLVLLQNKGGVLPLKAGAKVYLSGVSPAAAAARGLIVVDSLDQADVALIRTKTPFQQLHPNYFFGSRQHEGDLDFKDGSTAYEAIKAAAARVPTVVSIYLDRPAILTNIRDKAAGLIGEFGTGDEALLDIVTGKVQPRGRLPFELPSSMDEVRAQASDRPHDTAHPLYPIFFGLKG